LSHLQSGQCRTNINSQKIFPPKSVEKESGGERLRKGCDYLAHFSYQEDSVNSNYKELEIATPIPPVHRSFGLSRCSGIQVPFSHLRPLKQGHLCPFLHSGCMSGRGKKGNRFDSYSHERISAEMHSHKSIPRSEESPGSTSQGRKGWAATPSRKDILCCLSGSIAETCSCRSEPTNSCFLPAPPC